MSRKRVTYTETFFSPQGEGKYSGHPSAWIRFAHCNLRCSGFGQPDPTNSDTYILDFLDYDPVKAGVTKIEDLPVFATGCDSAYSWKAECAGLFTKVPAMDAAKAIIADIKSEHNPEGLFIHPKSGQDVHLCITGGEPMFSQPSLIAVLDAFIELGNFPRYITIETNTTQKLSADFIEATKRWEAAGLVELFFSCSPKLFSITGEKAEDAIKPDVMEQYAHLQQLVRNWGNLKVDGQIKIVAMNSDRVWAEFESVVQQFKAKGIRWPVYAMPVGATLEEQEITAGDVAVEAINRGYIIAPRIHVYLFGNAIGT